jgi:hypothetical protein
LVSETSTEGLSSFNFSWWIDREPYGVIIQRLKQG